MYSCVRGKISSIANGDSYEPHFSCYLLHLISLLFPTPSPSHRSSFQDHLPQKEKALTSQGCLNDQKDFTPLTL